MSDGETKSGDKRKRGEVPAEKESEPGAAAAAAKSVPDSPQAKRDKRAHHNALEQKRRDQIKSNLASLKSSVPTLKGETKPSQVVILNKAADFIQEKGSGNAALRESLQRLQAENELIIRSLPGTPASSLPASPAPSE